MRKIFEHRHGHSNRRNTISLFLRKEKKRREAAERQVIYNSLTKGEKLNLIASRTGQSLREFMRIMEIE